MGTSRLQLSYPIVNTLVKSRRNFSGIWTHAFMVPKMFAKGRLLIEMCILSMNLTGDIEEIHRTSDILHGK